MQLADGCPRLVLRAVRHAVDHQRARPADPFAAIGIKFERLLAVLDQVLVHDIQHLEEGHVRQDVFRLIFDELSRRLGASLPPYA